MSRIRDGEKRMCRFCGEAFRAQLDRGLDLYCSWECESWDNTGGFEEGPHWDDIEMSDADMGL